MSKTDFRPETHGFAFVNSWRHDEEELEEVRTVIQDAISNTRALMSYLPGGLLLSFILGDLRTEVTTWVNEALVEGLTEVIGEQLGVDPRAALAPRLIATLANGAARCAIDTWVASSGRDDLRALAEGALEVVAPAIETAVSSGSRKRRR